MLMRLEIDDAHQALQNELSVMQAAIESYESPAAALKALIDWHVAVATDPRVNGGMAIVPVERITTVARDVEYSPHTNRHTPFLRINFSYDDYDSRDAIYTMLAAAKEKTLASMDE